MRLNWLGYTYSDFVGYGKYSSRMVAALRKAGLTVRPELAGAALHPDWLLAEREMDWDCLTISCMPPYHLCKLPNGAGFDVVPAGASSSTRHNGGQTSKGPHWLLTMTEGGELPKGNKDPEKGAISKDWAEMINETGIERVIVPCEHNARVFRDGGVNCPVTVISGGTDPDEFPLVTTKRPVMRPYTFLALADRGFRKGWDEVYKAFFFAFGSVNDTGPNEVQLIIKCRPGGNDHIDFITHCELINPDPRIVYRMDDVDSLRDLFEQVDCFAIPSRTEGWGMPHREAAMSGLPVITQAHSGLDDGHTHEWAIVCENGHMQQIDDEGKHIAGEWMVADVDELAEVMRGCYDLPDLAAKLGRDASEWLRANQTWDIAAQKLIDLMHEQGVLYETGLGVTFDSYTSEEVKQLPSESDWQAADAMTDEEIEAAIASGPEVFA